MKTLVAALLASAFIAGPALACGFGKTAKHKMSTKTAALDQVKTEEAMSTFDPTTKLEFEDKKTEATEEPVKDEVKPVTE